MNSTAPAIEFSQVEKSFGSLKVLKGITGNIYPGEVVAVIGSSGCGKSTLLRCFNRLEKINSGKLVVNGIDLSPPQLSSQALRQLRAHVGMVFQQFNLFPHMTVLENLTLSPCKVLGVSKAESIQTGRMFLDKVGLLQKADAYPEQLSGGQKQRVAIARSLCMRPQIMLFDEPTSALDPAASAEVLAVMQDLARDGLTMIVVTHAMEFARRADTVHRMAAGKVVASGPPADVLAG
jgi:arginine/lysine/histidine/glutamine transport system ATP-binding protein